MERREIAGWTKPDEDAIRCPLRPDDGNRSVPVPFHYRGGLPGGNILLPVLHDPVYPVSDFFSDCCEKSRGPLAGDIGGGGYDGFTEALDQMSAERVFDQPDGDGSI